MPNRTSTIESRTAFFTGSKLLACIGLMLALFACAFFVQPQQAFAADYPGKSQLFFEFDNGGQADKPHVMSYDEYCQRTGWRTIDGVPTYKDEWVRETGIFYNSSNGTLTFDGYLDQTTTRFGQLNRIFVGPGRAGNLTVVFNVDWVRNLSDVRWSDSLPSCHGAMIANASGGSLTIASDNGSTVDLRMSKTRENKQSFNPIGIYCNGDVAIAGSIDLVIEARNSKVNNVNTDTSDTTYYTSAWGIWAGGKVIIRENAKTSIYAYSPNDNAGVKSAAIYSGHEGRLDDRSISITSSAEQSFTGASDGGAKVATFALDPDVMSVAQDRIYLGTKTGSSGNAVGNSPKVHCKWSNAGSFVCGYTGNATANTEDRTGYVLVKNDDFSQADYYSSESKYIVKPEVKMTLPRYGQVPGGVSSFTTVTPGLTIEGVSYEYIPGNSNSYTSLGSGQAIPTDAKGVKVTYTVGARDGYEIAKPYYSGGTYYTMGVFNGQEVKSNTMWYDNTTATFSVELNMDDILPENFVEYVSVMGAPMPENGKKVPKVIRSTQIYGDEKATVPESAKYKLAKLSSNWSDVPDGLKYREWWTNDRGEILSNNTSTSTTDDDEFEANRYYTYHVLLEATDNYVFGGGKYSSVSSLHKFINGYPAITQEDQYLYPGPDSRQRYIHICKSFKCPPTAVDEVEVFGVPEPVVGETARIGLPGNPNGTVAEGSPYRIYADRWKTGRDYGTYGTSGDSITSGNFTGTFEANTWYTYEVDLVPSSSSYSFDALSTYSNQIVWSGITASVNGKQCNASSGGVYVNLIRHTPPGISSSYPDGMLRLRYSFLTPPAEEDTVTDIQLTAYPAPVAGQWPGNSATSDTEGVNTVNLENAPGYSQLASNGNCQGVGNYTGLWLVGEDTLEQQYNLAIYSNTPFTDVMRSRFGSGNTYTFYACVDLGDKYFSFDNDGNLDTTVTVNGYPATLKVGTAGIAGQTNTKSHVALVTMVYTLPASSDEGWIVAPTGTKVTKTTYSGAMAKDHSYGGFDYYVFDRTVYHKVNKGTWTPPEGEEFWKWEMLKTGNGVELNYPYRNYVEIKANASTSGDVVLRILTAPEGAVPTDIRQGNWDIYVDSWNNNWGGASNSNRPVYDGAAKLRWPVVKNSNGTTDTSDDTTLIEGKDYTVSYVYSSGESVAAPTDQGTYRPVITGMGAYDGSRQLDPYYIEKAGIYNADVTFTGANWDYSTEPATPWVLWTGEAQQPAFTVTYNGMTLVEGTDYELGEWHNNTSVNSGAYVTITGKGNFSSSKNAIFQIRALDINEADVAAIPNEAYDGSWHKPKPVITYDGEALEEETHYYLSYSANMDAGTATVTITGNESAGWTGQREETFVIDKADISTVDEWGNVGTYQYTGEFLEPDNPIGHKDGRYLHVNSDFTIDSYSNNLFPGVGKVKVIGTGNYTGNTEIPFDIYISIYSNSSVEVGGIDSSYTYTGEPIEPDEVTVSISSNGHGAQTLTKDTGFTLSYGANTNAGNNAGWVEITPVDTDHYTGTKRVYFEIEQRDLSTATIEAIPDQVYDDGNAIEPPITVKLDGKTLESGDYSVSYEDNYEVGTAIVTVSGQGNYKGQVSTTFYITLADKTELGEAIQAAKDAESGVATSDAAQGSDLPEGTVYTTTSDKKALDDAIAEAEAVFDNHDATQDEVDEAKQAVSNATDTYEAAKKTSSKAGKNGWVKDAGKWYYYKDGAVMKGWQQVGGKWYYLSPSDGVMLTGWQKVGGKWYYLDSNGAMLTGWQKISGTWYYLNSSGAMLTGWQKISGTWYYFKSSGAMAANEWCGGYWLNASGSWTYQYKASWKKDSTGWWYGDTSGWYARSATYKIDDKNYTFNARGYWV